MLRRLASLLLITAAAAATACGGKEKGGQLDSLNSETSRRSRGPDPIVLRIPRTGGSVRAYLYPKLDSVIWNGRGVSTERAIGFDPEGGTIAVVNDAGLPGRIDLRFGVASIATKAKLSSLTSVNGSDIYGLDSKGTVVRLARSGEWKLNPPSPATSLFPQLDGSLIIVSQQASRVTLWKVRPPESKLLDTVEFEIPGRGARAQVGDRIYFATDTGLVGIRTRDMSVVTPISLNKRVSVLAPTPSGDRVYASMDGQKGLTVIDRYTDKVAERISLPGEVSDLRMDPLGRYVLVKPVRGDSAWVVAVSTNRVVGSVPTTWSGDLPACAPDGAIAVSNGRDVIFVDGETLQSVRTIVGGAKDYWYFMFWNGFRPTVAGMVEQPAQSETQTGDDSATEDDVATDTQPTVDQTPVPPTVTPSQPSQPQQRPADSAPHGPPPPPRPPVTVPVEPIRPPASQTTQVFTVSFAALLNQEKANELANTIIVNGVKAHVVASKQAGTPIFRVILGPYSSRTAAEQVGRDSKRQFWVYAGEP